jgi:hypothetical protein
VALKLHTALVDRHQVTLSFRWCHARVRLGLAAGVAIALLVAVPAAPAGANVRPSAGATAVAGPAALALPPGGIGQVSAPNLDELLGEGELGSGGVMLSALEAPVLAKQLSRLPGIADLATVNGLGGSAGVEQAMLLAIEQLAGEGELVEELVGGFGLAFDFEEQLEATYETFAATHAGAPESLEEAVEEALNRSPEEVIEEGLESLTLGELLSKLIGKAAQPTVLVQALFAACEQEELQELLGSALASGPFTQATVAEAAAAIGITSAELAEKLGKTPGQLPATALALFAPLENGQQLGVFAAKQGLAFGLVGEAPPVEEEAEQEEQEGASGAGPPVKGSGSEAPAESGTQNTPAVTAATSSADTPGATPATALAAGQGAAAKVKIVGRGVSGAGVTLTVQVSGAGRLTVSGHGIAPIHRAIAHAGRVTLKLHVTRAAAASLHRHHRLKLALRVSLASGSGASSVAAATVTLV